MAPTGPGGIDDFRKILRYRMAELYCDEYGPLHQRSFVMPVGLLLVIDDANGGDITAVELFKRFNLLHSQSQNIIDFYFLGWEWNSRQRRSAGIKFNLLSFLSCQSTLSELGVRFGGNADLILLDAHFSPGRIALNFEEAICVNLSRSVAEKEIPSAGEFLQTIIDAAKTVRENAPSQLDRAVVFHISDRLGVATAKTSFLDFILRKWGEVIGAKKLKAIAVRNIGPNIDLDRMSLDVVSQGPTSGMDY